MIEIKVPVLPESISEATVAVWHKQPGDPVQVDDVIVEIETDKVVLEVPAEEAGVLTKIIAQEGETVGAQQILGTMTEGSEIQDNEPGEPETESEAQEDTSQKSEPQIKNETNDSVAAEKPPEPQESISEEPQATTAQVSTPQPSILSLIHI